MRLPDPRRADYSKGRGPAAYCLALLIAVCLGLGLPPGVSDARVVVAQGVELRCAPLGGSRLQCDYRLERTVPAGAVSPRAGDVALADEGLAETALTLVAVPTVVAVPVPMVAVRAAESPTPPSAGLTASADAPPRPVDSIWIWSLLLPGTLLVALVLLLVLVAKTRRIEKSDLEDTRPGKAARTLAYLESRDGGSERHAITRTAFRIGRHSDNDLTIPDTSISRQHAEVHRRRDSGFTITDLDSMNGVFVNQKKIDSVALCDGDFIEIGDKTFRFRTTAHAEPAAEETAAQESVNRMTPLSNFGERA